jgi:hypothetical protein
MCIEHILIMVMLDTVMNSNEILSFWTGINNGALSVC